MPSENSDAMLSAEQRVRREVPRHYRCRSCDEPIADHDDKQMEACSEGLRQIREDEAAHVTEYMTFELLPNEGRKTDTWRVLSRRSGDVLGLVKWYGAWRQYCFFPGLGTVFNVGCMNDINEFIGKQMDARRKAKTYG